MSDTYGNCDSYIIEENKNLTIPIFLLSWYQQIKKMRPTSVTFFLGIR